MQVRDILNTRVAFCTPQTTLRTVSQMMIDFDCGVIPVVRAEEDPRVMGIVTDRDITCRAVAQGINPLHLRAEDVMSFPVVMSDPDASIEECAQLMEKYRVRRLPVADATGTLLGIISQTDIVHIGPCNEAAALVETISLPTPSASQVPKEEKVGYDTRRN